MLLKRLNPVLFTETSGMVINLVEFCTSAQSRLLHDHVHLCADHAVSAGGVLQRRGGRARRRALRQRRNHGRRRGLHPHQLPPRVSGAASLPSIIQQLPLRRHPLVVYWELCSKTEIQPTQIHALTI